MNRKTIWYGVWTFVVFASIMHLASAFVVNSSIVWPEETPIDNMFAVFAFVFGGIAALGVYWNRDVMLRDELEAVQTFFIVGLLSLLAAIALWAFGVPRPILYIGLGIVGFVLSFVFGIVCLYIPGIRRKREEERAAKEQKNRKRLESKMRGRQETMNGRMCRVLKRAACLNMSANVLEGTFKPASGVSALLVREIPEGTTRRILAYFEDTDSVGGIIPILQIGINLLDSDPNRAIHVFSCPYGPDTFHPEGQFDQVMNLCAYYLGNFTLYLRGNDERKAVFLTSLQSLASQAGGGVR